MVYSEETDHEGVIGKWFVVGLVSFGEDACGQTTLPGVYTRVDTYWKWIHRKIISSR